MFQMCLVYVTIYVSISEGEELRIFKYERFSVNVLAFINVDSTVVIYFMHCPNRRYHILIFDLQSLQQIVNGSYLLWSYIGSRTVGYLYISINIYLFITYVDQTACSNCMSECLSLSSSYNPIPANSAAAEA